MLTCKKMKKKYMAILEVDPVSFDGFMKLEQLNVKWDSCRVFEHFSALRCYGCGGFNHTHSVCKEDKVCLNCGKSDHNENECQNEPACVNCMRANQKLKLNLNTKHSRFDLGCEVFQRNVENIRLKTQYSK